MQPVLEIKDLSKRFGENRAVENFNLKLEKGVIYGLIGPDGAGKTTTMRLIAGLITPSSGQINALGHAVPSEARKVHRFVGYMPQQYSLYGDLTVEENLRFFAGMFGLKRSELLEREKRLLEIARLEAYRSRIASALSGGMYKKLALACALIHRPRLLLLDEPTNGVDPISRKELWAFLYELGDDGLTVLISTPYMDEAERCGRVGLLADGKLIAEGNPDELKRQFRQTVFELEVSPELQAKRRLAELADATQIYTVGHKLHVLTARGETFENDIKRALAPDEFQIDRLAVVPPSFEDVFLFLTGPEAFASNDRKSHAAK